MIPLPLVLPFLRRYWKYAAGAILLALIWLAWHHHGTVRYKAGEAHIRVQWEADRAKWQAAITKQEAENAEHLRVTTSNNAKELADANTQLQAIAADRDSLAGRMRDYQNRLRTSQANQASSELGTVVAAGIAARATEAASRAEQLWDLYDKACQRDAVRFGALQDEIRPQL